MEQQRLGDLLVRHHIITAAQLEQARKVQMKCPSAPLGQILCRLGFLSRDLLSELLDAFGKRPRLGEVLVRRAVLSQERLEQALAVSIRNGTRLGATLLSLHIVSEEELARAIADQYDLTFVSLADMRLSSDLARVLSGKYARENRIAPITIDEQSVTIAVAFPPKRDTVRHIESGTRLKVKIVIAGESEIRQFQRRLYFQESVTRKVADRPAAYIEISEDSRADQEHGELGAATAFNVDRLVKAIICAAIRAKASDIHFESVESGLNIRFRVDGMLQPFSFGKEESVINGNARQIVSKLKVLCDMDIAERRRPQDSSFKMLVKNDESTRTVDFRVSTVPNSFGESVVIRVLDKHGGSFSLESLGYTEAQIAQLHGALDKPTGIFLVTGPTGSGKSSTLYALLSRLNTPETKTLTVEDPIEYSMPGITQTEVNEAIGNTFAKMLRAFLRQDPDNIMLGEIRDGETATISIRAAMTGHTVLSTLHTNDATSAITRLIDIGVDPTLLTTTLRCVLAQRLARRICVHCRTDYIPSGQLRGEFCLPANLNLRFFRGSGCAHCNFTGFAGRVPITELWIPTQDELLSLSRSPDNLALRRLVFVPGKRMTMVEDGLRRVFRGETTLEELLRIVPHEQIASCQANVHHWLNGQGAVAA